MKSLSLYQVVIALCLGFTLCTVSAQDAKQNTSQTDQPIDLVADKGFYDQENGIATYEGNVVVKQEGMTLWADKLVIMLKDGSAEHIEAEGAPAKFEYKGQEKPIHGSAQRIDYEVADKLVTLTGKAVVTQGTDTIKGDTLTYNLTKDTLGGSRIRMTFTPTNSK